ncbi:Enoyl-CoA hydratase [Paraburkholderia caribensis MBA4]|uniref:Enoyl-CoA hydratase n=1 Tax=Paraburkholderia caribensis MBA4 TaxID=1323664 RepID=A0A0P0RIN8_9BURK|nr:enoyl-CoA hydratase/isomerase family protein [Paraburkholderia caribensis]ALL68484.1 Enoyl-CoA hydratase [Paraburkholderia caribensis MBA4]
MSHIVVSKHENWAHLRIARPEKRNALNQSARLDLLRALESLAGKVHVVVITGSDEWFCCGADIKERAQFLAEGKPDTTAQDGMDIAMAIKEFPGIVIAAVNGLALGFGVNLINCSDLAIGSDIAKLGLPELRAASFASMSAATGHLSGLNRKRLGWMVFNTESIDAETALSWGLLNQVVPAENLASRVQELAEKISTFDFDVLKETKRAIAQMPDFTTDWRVALTFGQDVAARIKGHIAGR